MSKITMLAAVAAGYVLGARAGRERYDQIVEKVEDVRTNPTFQKGTRRVQEKAQEKAAKVTGGESSPSGTDISDSGQSHV